MAPLASLKDKITYRTYHTLDGQAELDNIGHAPYDILEIKNAFDNLLKNFQAEVIKRNESERKSALYHLAAQVAHDIRSPLVALDVAAQLASGLPEDRRLVIRNAAQRIHDIANNLLQEYKEKAGHLAMTPENAMPTLALLMSMLDRIISEKRAQYSSRSIQFDFKIENNAQGLFVKVNIIEFKRMMSNLINNSVEAIVEQGVITILLSQNAGNAVIRIIDNGCGIPKDILSRLLSSDVSFGKHDGHGLGLHHARSVIQCWDGSIIMLSEEGEGTTVSIFLPAMEPPGWFVSRLIIQKETTVVIFDDDASIHQVWSHRFRELSKESQAIEVKHFTASAPFKEWISQSKDRIQRCFFLMDYEILTGKESGLDLIEEFGLEKYAVLVTSRYEEKLIIDRCSQLKMGLIPKAMSAFIPVQLVDSYFYDALLIDDDPLVRQAWEMSAIIHSKTIKTFSSPESFIAFSTELDRCTPIYIDSRLSNNVRGEKIAEAIYEMGFKNLYLTTGMEMFDVNAFPYLCGVINKMPPWENFSIREEETASLE